VCDDRDLFIDQTLDQIDTISSAFELDRFRTASLSPV
jgi:hypothetical protein